MAITYGEPKRLKGTKKYYSRTYDRETGRRAWSATGFETLKEAKEWVATRRMDEALGPTRAGLRHAEAVTLGAAIKEWLEEKLEKVSHDRHEIHELKSSYWLHFFGGSRKLRDLNSDDIRRYLRKRKAGLIRPKPKSRSMPLSATTINEDLRGLSSFFIYCMNRDWLLKSPTRGIEKYKGGMRRRVRSITPQQEETLLQACRFSSKVVVQAKRNAGGPQGGKTTADKRRFTQTFRSPDYLYPIVLIALRSGLRRRTILHLRWEHVDLECATWNIPSDIMKTRVPYQAPMAASLVTALKEYRGALLGKYGPGRVAAEELLFYLQKSKASKVDLDSPAPDSKPRTASFKRAFKKAALRSGMKDLSFHDCRRIFLNRLRERGVPVDVAIKLSAHTSLQTVMKHYREIPESATREAVRMLDVVEAPPAPPPAAASSRGPGRDEAARGEMLDNSTSVPEAPS